MKNEEKRGAVLATWRDWKRTHPERGNTGTDALMFHNYLMTERPHLLPSGPDNTWDRVHGWLLRAREVTD